MENWNKIAGQKNLTEGPNGSKGGVTLFRMFRKSYMVMGLQEKTNEVWRRNTGE